MTIDERIEFLLKVQARILELRELRLTDLEGGAQ
jgi:hypothetical protein